MNRCGSQPCRQRQTEEIDDRRMGEELVGTHPGRGGVAAVGHRVQGAGLCPDGVEGSDEVAAAEPLRTDTGIAGCPDVKGSSNEARRERTGWSGHAPRVSEIGR